MPWRVVDGRTIKVGGPQLIEVEYTIEIEDELTCPECGKEYKTERGLANHQATH